MLNFCLFRQPQLQAFKNTIHKIFKGAHAAYIPKTHSFGTNWGFLNHMPVEIKILMLAKKYA